LGIGAIEAARRADAHEGDLLAMGFALLAHRWHIVEPAGFCDEENLIFR
jgi:hypothetical protein